MDDLHTPACFASHMGVWAIQPDYARQALAWAQAHDAQPPTMRMTCAPLSAVEIVETGRGGAFAVHGNGVASIALNGAMMKGFSKYGGTSTVAARTALRAAADRADVESILMVIDSPGGHVAGTQELADEVAAIAARMPVHVHVDDLGASAAYWVASQATTISVNRTGEVGSIGVMTALVDTSEAMAAAGVRVIPITTGPLKGTGMPGVEITDEQVAAVQARVDAVHEHFLAAVMQGRGLSREQAEAVATGGTFGAEEAVRLGLVDAIRNLDGTAAAAAASAEEIMAGQRRRRRRAALDLYDLDC